MEKEKYTKGLLEALIKVQADITPVGKDGYNPHFKNKHSTISGILESVKPILTKNGLILSQRISSLQDQPLLITEIISADGGIMSSFCPIIAKDKNDPQKFGAAVTYARRYSLVSILNLEEVDDDGQQAATPKPINYSVSPAGDTKGKKWEELDVKTLEVALEYFKSKNKIGFANSITKTLNEKRSKNNG